MHLEIKSGNGISGHSYNASTIVIYDSTVVIHERKFLYNIDHWSKLSGTKVLPLEQNNVASNKMFFIMGNCQMKRFWSLALLITESIFEWRMPDL